MAFIEIKGKALRDFDAQRAAQPGVISRSGGGGPATYTTSNNNRPISSYASNPAPYKPKTLAESATNPGNYRPSVSGPAPSSGQQGPMPDGGTLAGHISRGGGLYDASVSPLLNRPAGTGVPASGAIPRQLPAPQRPQTMASNGINYAPGARPSYGLLSPAAEGLAYNAQRVDSMQTNWRGKAVFPGDPAAAAAYDEVYTSLHGQVDPADLERYATKAGQDVASKGMIPRGTVGAQQGPMPDGSTLDSFMRAGGNAYGGSAPSAPSVPQAPPPAPPPLIADYVPPTRSRYEDAPGFDQPALAAAYVNQQRGDIQREYAGNLARIREAMAARGLSQAGVSGAEETAIMMNELSRANALGRSRADATARTMEMGREDALQRAGQIDNYGLARGGFGISYAGDNRAARREDTMLPLDAQGKAIANQGGAINNQGGLIANQANQAAADVATATTQDRISQIRSIATNAQLQNEATRFDIDQAIQAGPTVRATAQAQLQEIEQRVAKAARENDWATVDQLGKLAANIAKNGGFKIAGGVLGGLMLTNPVTAGGAGYAFAAGGALDQVLGG